MNSCSFNVRHKTLIDPAVKGAAAGHIINNHQDYRFFGMIHIVMLTVKIYRVVAVYE